MEKRVKNGQLSMASIYLFANIFNKAIAFLTVPIFSRLLTTAEYGNVSTYSSYVLVLQYFMGLSSEYTIRNAFVEYKDDIPRYIASMYSLSCVCSIIVSGIVLIFNYTFGISTMVIAICCVVQSFMTFCINAMSYRLMMEKKHIERAIYIAGPNLLSVVFGIVFIVTFNNSRDVSRIFGYTIAYLLLGVYSLISSLSIIQSSKDITKYWKYILKISPPLIVHGLSMIVLSQLDRIMITCMRGSSETGIYSIVYSLSMIVTAVTQAIEGIWTPWFTEKYNEGKYSLINKKATHYLKFTTLIIVMIMLVSPELFKIMTPKSYWSGIYMIPPLVSTSYFIYAYSYYIGLELHEKKSKTISLSTLIATATNVFLNALFIPKYGALAAAYTTLVAYVVLFLIHWWNSFRINKNVFKIRCFFGSSIGVFVAAVVFYIMQEIWIIRWGIAVSILMIEIIYILKNKEKFIL